VCYLLKHLALQVQCLAHRTPSECLLSGNQVRKHRENTPNHDTCTRKEMARDLESSRPEMGTGGSLICSQGALRVKPHCHYGMNLSFKTAA
jgi:hypothetical protein